MMHLSLKSFAVIFLVSVSIAKCRLQMYSMKNVAIFLVVGSSHFLNKSMTVSRYKYFQ